METFNRLVGVSESTTKPLPAPPPIPQDEPSEQALSRRASRVSLPKDLHRQPSKKSLKSLKSDRRDITKDQDIPPVPSSSYAQAFSLQGTPADTPPIQTTRTSNVTAEEEDNEDFAWGPNHPCFPHPNPHCLPNSQEYQNTRVIRVKRDWLVSSDLYPQYQNLYPEILDPLVSDTDFRFLVTNINTRLEAVFSPWTTRSWLDAMLGVLTGFLWDDLRLTGVDNGMRNLEAFIEKWNAQQASEKHEIRLVQLRRTGFMSLDFVIPDPGLDAAGDGRVEE